MHPEATVNRVASRQGGVITRQQLFALGVSEAQIERRVSSGLWVRYARGAYAVFDQRDKMDRLRAATAVLPAAVVSHFSAASIHEMSRVPQGPPSVLVHTSTTHVFPGVSVVRCHDLAPHHTQIVDDMRTTTAARTIVDLAGRLTPGQLGICLDEALSTSLVEIDDVACLLSEVARKGKPGVTLLRAALDDRTGADYSRSVLEQRGIRILEDAGFGGYKLEYAIPWSPRQRFDVAFPQEQIAVEWDSRRWHAQLGAFDRDRERDRAAVANGWRVLRFTWSDVYDRPGTVASTLRKLVEISP